MKNVKYYYHLNFNLSWKNPAKVELSAGETERQKRAAKPTAVEMLPAVGDLFKGGPEVFPDQLRKPLQTCPDRTGGNVPQGTILLLRMAKHRRLKRKDLGIKM